MIKTIGIIGGLGRTGSMFAKGFEQLGKEVLITDLDTISDEKSLVRHSDVVMISVPIDVSPAVVKRIEPWLRADQLLADVCSVKSAIIPAMLDTKAAVISTHPMFAAMPDMAKQNIILLPVRPNQHLDGFKHLFEQLGLNAVVMEEWQKHDEFMSVIQGLMHFFHIVFTQTLQCKGVDLETLLSICSPVYQANFAFTCRILQRDPHLYTHILMDNPENISVLKSFIEQAQESLKLIQAKDETSFKDRFVASRDYLGVFGEIFSNQSDFLIEKIKEYPPD